MYSGEAEHWAADRADIPVGLLLVKFAFDEPPSCNMDCPGLVPLMRSEDMEQA